MKLLVDEMPALSEDCLFFKNGDCKFDGNDCALRCDVDCPHLKAFKPFVFDAHTKMMFEASELLSRDVPGRLERLIERRINVLAELLNVSCTTDPREILDQVIKKLREEAKR